MTILIHAIKSTGERKIIAVAPLNYRDKVEEYCAKRNAESIEAGYNCAYKYEITDAAWIEDESDLDFTAPQRTKVTGA